MSSVTGGLSDGLAKGILNQDDTQLVADGVPTYLLMVDGFLANDPDNASVLLAGAKLYSAYGGTFVKDAARGKAMTEKAFTYALKGSCIREKLLCDVKEVPFPVFETRLKDFDKGELPAIYTLATTWTGWIQTHSADWNAVADIAKVKALLVWADGVNPAYDNGSISLYLGALATILPPAMGGKPDEGKAYFEKAISISDGHNLMAKTLYAERYARMVFDRALHDRLLKEVVAAEPKVEGLTLMNVLAQQKAKELLESADSYF
ncbi:MAG: hypothetical protein GC134_06485 [Proteobacteria bacterium]|nr:hypothetical protein [Pseudomonadota bacterium]